LSNAKEREKEEMKECEEKEKERKEVKGDEHIKGCGSQIFKSKSRSILKISSNETWRDYKRL